MATKLISDRPLVVWNRCSLCRATGAPCESCKKKVSVGSSSALDSVQIDNTMPMVYVSRGYCSGDFSDVFVLGANGATYEIRW